MVSAAARKKTEMIGKILAEYRIVEELGGQAGAQVFKAIGYDSRRPVAIKLFPSALSRDKSKLHALLDSLRKTSGLNQPGIPRLIGSGLNGGRAYIVMPFMTGGSLQERLEIGQIRSADTLPLLDKIAAVLEQTHSMGVVHGHLSPAEVMFDDTGQLQIIGLGLTPFLSDGAGTTEELAGREHVAPEVREGGRPTPASDQYSLAVLAFELLTGQCVHEALEAGALNAMSGGTGDTAKPKLNLKVIEVLQRGLEEDPSQRFAGVSDMMRALRQALRQIASPIHAPQPSRRERRRPPQVVGRTLGWGAMSLAVVALGCFALTLPALAAARWMRVDFGSIAGLFSGQATAPTSAPADHRRITLPPERAPLMPTPVSIGQPQVLAPTPATLGEAPQPAQDEPQSDDEQHDDPAPTALSAADEGLTGQEAADAPQSEGALADDPAGATPTPATLETVVSDDPLQPSPTPEPTATASGMCSDPSKQICTESLRAP
jgi:hypothetical protein